MTVRQHRTKWMLDVAVKGKRYREYGFKNRSLAKAREQEIMDSGGAAPKHQLLTEFVTKWYELHGTHLRDRYRYPRTLAVAETIGGFVKDFDAAKFAEFRVVRLDQVSVATVNHETRYLRAVFAEMKRLGHYFSDNPMSTIRTLPEFETELSYLKVPEIKDLLLALDNSRNKHVGLVARICLSTGARWGEAQGLTNADLMLDNELSVLRFSRTKNGKVRYVPVSSHLVDLIKDECNPSGNLFNPCKDAFRSVVKRNNIDLPKGQNTHILRHTFASHFMMNGGDILALQKTLGHSDLKLTMRYSHLSPDHLSKVLELNPLSHAGFGKV